MSFGRRLLRLVGPPGERRGPAAEERLDLAGDPLGLLLLVVGLEALRSAARRPRSVQSCLSLRPSLLRDDGVGGVEDQLGAPVVLLELDDRGPGLVALEVEDVAQVGAAPGVDRLVVVAHDAQVVVGRGERPDDPVLGGVRVLVLVDVEVAPAGLVAGEDLGLRLEEADGLDEEVVEVERAGGAQALRVAGRDPGDLALEVGGRALGQVLHRLEVVLGPADRLQDGPRPQRRRPGPAGPGRGRPAS